jgi:hypothetical protein
MGPPNDLNPCHSLRSDRVGPRSTTAALIPIRVRVGSRRNDSIASAVLGGLICAVLSAGGFSVVLMGAPLTGGMPYVADSLNHAIGRVLIATGAFLTAGLAAYAFHEAWRLHRARGNGGVRSDRG